MPVGENRLRRDEDIWTEFKSMKSQGFKSIHIYNVLANKYYLSSVRVKDIVAYAKEKTQREAVK